MTVVASPPSERGVGVHVARLERNLRIDAQERKHVFGQLLGPVDQILEEQDANRVAPEAIDEGTDLSGVARHVEIDGALSQSLLEVEIRVAAFERVHVRRGDACEGMAHEVQDPHVGVVGEEPFPHLRRAVRVVRVGRGCLEVERAVLPRKQPLVGVELFAPVVRRAEEMRLLLAATHELRMAVQNARQRGSAAFLRACDDEIDFLVKVLAIRSVTPQSQRTSAAGRASFG